MKIELTSTEQLYTATLQSIRFVGGNPGQRYNIRLTNVNTSHRVLAVVTVDGRNVLDSSPGSVKGGGYVLAPGETWDIEGWRESLESAATFFITASEDSFAAKLGDPSSHVGIIGLATYLPLGRNRQRPPVRQRYMSGMGSPITRGGATGSAGTGFGPSVSSPVKSTTFERDLSTEVVQLLRYNTTDNLIAAGIFPACIRQLHPGPQAFPADAQAAPSFCKRPA